MITRSEGSASLVSRMDPSLSNQNLTLRLTLRPSSATCIVSPPVALSLPAIAITSPRFWKRCADRLIRQCARSAPDAPSVIHANRANQSRSTRFSNSGQEAAGGCGKRRTLSVVSRKQRLRRQSPMGRARGRWRHRFATIRRSRPDRGRTGSVRGLRRHARPSDEPTRNLVRRQ